MSGETPGAHDAHERGTDHATQGTRANGHAMRSTQANDHDDCSSCALDMMPSDRRAFLRETGLSVAAILIALGSRAANAFAEPLAFTTALDSGPQGHRYTIPAADGATIDKSNEVILVRWQKAVYAFHLSCPHQNTALRWNAGDKRFQCPKHRSKYTPEGKFIEGRATRGMDRLAITRDGADAVVVDSATIYREDRDAVAYAAAVVHVD